MAINGVYSSSSKFRSQKTHASAFILRILAAQELCIDTQLWSSSATLKVLVALVFQSPATPSDLKGGINHSVKGPHFHPKLRHRHHGVVLGGLVLPNEPLIMIVSQTPDWLRNLAHSDPVCLIFETGQSSWRLACHRILRGDKCYRLYDCVLMGQFCGYSERLREFWCTVPACSSLRR